MHIFHITTQFFYDYAILFMYHLVDNRSYGSYVEHFLAKKGV